MTMSTLTFAELREVNVERCERWHPGFRHVAEFGPSDERDWTGADWSNAMCGEAGEAANVVKKLRRLATGAAPGPNDPPAAQLHGMLADELGYIIAYCDLLAAHYNIDLGAAVVDKFNRISERQGFPERL